MNLFILSDLHIWGSEDPLYTSLISVVRNRTGAGDILVLAGDVFDLFVGNKPIFVRRYSELFQALDEAGGRGVEIHYIEGNHDFLIHRAFQSVRGIQIHERDVSLQIQDRKFYFAHGDLADRKDYSYRILRAFLRSWLMKVFVHLAPGSLIDKIGRTSSQKSRNKKPAIARELSMSRIEIMRNIYRSYAAEHLAQGNDYVVMGHCHDLDEMCFNIGGRPGQYVNVGYPRMHGSFLSWSPGDQKIQREKLPD
jgi:UDP-2,3-diacylglucosamine hydrolase